MTRYNTRASTNQNYKMLKLNIPANRTSETTHEQYDYINKTEISSSPPKIKLYENRLQQFKKIPATSNKAIWNTNRKKIDLPDGNDNSMMKNEIKETDTELSINFNWLLNFKVSSIFDLSTSKEDNGDGSLSNKSHDSSSRDNDTSQNSSNESSGHSNRNIHKKPPFTYTELIERALKEKRQLTVSGIYQWISERFPYYNQNDDRWKNSVRHNLSINPHFRKGAKASQGAGHLWNLSDMEFIEDTSRNNWKKNRLKNYLESVQFKSVDDEDGDDIDNNLEEDTNIIVTQSNNETITTYIDSSNNTYTINNNNYIPNNNIINQQHGTTLNELYDDNKYNIDHLQQKTSILYEETNKYEPIITDTTGSYMLNNMPNTITNNNNIYTHYDPNKDILIQYTTENSTEKYEIYSNDNSNIDKKSILIDPIINKYEMYDSSCNTDKKSILEYAASDILESEQDTSNYIYSMEYENEDTNYDNIPLFPDEFNLSCYNINAI